MSCNVPKALLTVGLGVGVAVGFGVLVGLGVFVGAGVFAGSGVGVGAVVVVSEELSAAFVVTFEVPV